MSELRYDQSVLAEPAVRNEDGFLRARAVLTRVGVFEYQNGDGTVRRELRHPDDVFDPASLESLRMVPVTNGHPDRVEHGGLVTSDNARELQRGHIGEDIEQDAYYVAGPIVVTDAETINEIQSGKQAISCGYSVDRIDEPGEWLGQRYDARQTNIRYNHVAVVEQGRAGADARITLDSQDAVCVTDAGQIREDTMPDLKKITLDGVEYQAEGPVLAELNRVKAQLDELKGSTVAKDELSRVEAERDTLKQGLDDAKTRIDELEKSTVTEDQIRAAAKERIDVLRVAEQVVPDASLDEMDVAAIKREVVKAKSPNIALDDKDDVYVDARYDAVVEQLDQERANRQRAVVDGADRANDARRNGDPKSARDRMIQQMKGRYRNPGNGKRKSAYAGKKEERD